MNEAQIPNPDFVENQTQFNGEGAYWEPVTAPVDPNPPQSEPAAESSKKPLSTPLKFGLVLAGILTVLIMLIGVVALLTGTNRPSITAQPTPTPSTQPQIQVSSQFKERLDQLENSLEEAKPVTNPMPFPTIDKNIRLEVEE